MKLPGGVSVALTLVIALVGGFLATLIHVPVSWLLGSAIAVTVASLAGLRTRIPNRLRDVTFVILGAQAGAGVNADVLSQIAIWPLSFAIQMIGVAGVVALTYLFLRRAFGWDKETSLFASLPGAMSFVLAAAAETRADMVRISVVQSVRLMFLLGALTPTLAWLEGDGPVAAVARGGHAGSLLESAYLVGACLVGALLGALARIPGGLLLGSLAASAIMHVSGVAAIAIPLWISNPALVVLGGIIGTRVRREHRSALLPLLPASLGSFAIGLGVSVLAGLVAHLALGIEFGKLALAYSPGALEALTILAFQFNLDPAYVAAHHVVRFVGIAVLVPVLARRVPSSTSDVRDWRRDD